MIQILPSSDVPPGRDINVYYLENASAEEAAKLLSSVAARSAMQPAAGRSAVKVAGEFESMVQIIPDKATNALLITASQRDFEILKEVIKKIDVRRRQVYVEAVIMEVNQERLRELGSDLSAAGLYQNPGDDVTVFGAVQDTSTFDAISNLPSIQDFTISPINVKVFLKALQGMTDVNVLSTPQILTSNNQKAKIVVAQNVPFLTGTTQTVGAVSTAQIQRQDVGVTLEITPEILEGSRVRMDIRQEISSLAETPESVLLALGPTTNKREATTTVVVADNQTVVIGGLIRDDVSVSDRKIPLLGDIPLIGWFFKFQTKKNIKSNLLIFLTPHVVHDSSDLDVIRQRKSDDMKRAMEQGKLKNLVLKEQFLQSINPPQGAR